MSIDETVRQLDDMQAQIIHGKRFFGDTADLIRKQEAVRLAALKAVATALKTVTDEALFHAHRILANCEPDGIFRGQTINSVIVEESRCSACGDVTVPGTDLCSRCLGEWESNRNKN